MSLIDRRSQTNVDLVTAKPGALEKLLHQKEQIKAEQKASAERIESITTKLEIARMRVNTWVVKNLVAKGQPTLALTIDPAISKPVADAIHQGRKLFDNLAGAKSSGSVEFKPIPPNSQYGQNRPYYENGIVYMPQAASTETTAKWTVHELGHHLEREHPAANKMAIDFYQQVTTGNSLKKLKDIYPWATETEQYKEDKFSDKYLGKWYSVNGAVPDGTELISQGLQRLATNPLKLFKDDKAVFMLILKVLNL